MLLSIRRILEIPAGYRLFTMLIGGDVLRRRFIIEHLAPRQGWRVLDVGCGTGELLEHMPKGVSYVGFDPCARYLERARLRYGTRGQFLLGCVEEWSPQTMGSFDAIMAFGLLHHLPDFTVADFFRKARQSLRKPGVLVVLEPCLRSDLSPVARLFLKNDRGAYVRYRADYEALARLEFPNMYSVYDHKGLHLPYCALVISCRENPGHIAYT